MLQLDGRASRAYGYSRAHVYGYALSDCGGRRRAACLSCLDVLRGDGGFGSRCPSAWWYEVGKKGYWTEAWHELRKVRDKDDRKAALEAQYAPVAKALDDAAKAEMALGQEPDEVTLVDVSVFPAVGAQGTQSGGHTLPVARIPLTAIDAWWIVSGETIKGSGGSLVSAGPSFSPSGTEAALRRVRPAPPLARRLP